MATTSLAKKTLTTDSLNQGDIFRNVKYSYIGGETDEYVDIIEYDFPLAVIVSQACDVTFMSQMQSKKEGKPTKFMPTILLCPIYNGDAVQVNKHLTDISNQIEIELKLEERFYTSKEREFAKNDLHYRFHRLDVKVADKYVIENGLVDFKHCFSVPTSYLLENRDKRLYRLDSLFAEQVTLKFSAYLSRVAIP